MAHTVKNWQDLPSTATPLSAAALEDLEARLGAYADTVGGTGTDVNAVPKSLYTGQTTLAAGSSTASTPVTVAPPLNGLDRATVVTDSSTASGLRFSAKTAPYNICEAGASPINTATQNRSAINTAILAAAGNGPCLVPPGNYDVDGVLNCVSNTHLYGLGNDQSTIRTTVGGRMIGNSPFAQAANDITLEGLELDGNRDNLSVLDDTLVEFRGVEGGARVNRVTVKDCHMHHSRGLGFAFKAAENVRAQDNLIHDNKRDALGAYSYCRYVIFMGNRIYNTGDDFIALGANGSDMVAVGNVIGGGGPSTGTGIAVRSCDRVAVTGNTIFEPFSNGLLAVDDDPAGLNAPCRDVVFTGNTIYDIGHDGTIQKGNGIQIESGFAGGTGGVQNIIVANNIFRSTRNYGASMIAATGTSVQNVTFQGNQFIGGSIYPDVHAINFGGTHTGTGFVNMRFLGNTFREWAGVAINCGKQIEGLDILNNLALNNCKNTATTKAAFLLGAQNNVQFVGNRCTDTQGTKTMLYGVAIGSTTTQLLIATNNFTGVGTSGKVGTMASTAFEHANVGHDGTFRGGTHNTTLV